jgi:hypothetical protein
MTPSITTFSIMELRITTLSIMPLIIMPLSSTTLSITTRCIMPLIIMTLSNKTLGITTLCITIKMALGLAVKNILLNDPIFLIMLSVIMLNVTAPSFPWPNQGQGSLLEGEGLVRLTSLY